jgi:small subunit ribosomal protein S18
MIGQEEGTFRVLSSCPKLYRTEEFHNMMRRPKTRKPRKKFCYFRAEKIEYIDYKNVALLRRFVSDRGKILPRRQTGTSAKYQRMLTVAIKRARFIGLLPYTAE